MSLDDFRQLADHFIENHRDHIPFLTIKTEMSFDGDQSTSITMTLSDDDSDGYDLEEEIPTPQEVMGND